MRKRILQIILAFVIVVFALPLQASALGGFVAFKGEKIYHDPLCDIVNGSYLEDLVWFDSSEKAERAGCKPCEECDASNSEDFFADGDLYFRSEDNKITSALEIERLLGILDGYEAGKEEGDEAVYNSGYGAGYDEGYDEGRDAGYDTGYNEGLEAAAGEAYIVKKNAYLFSFVIAAGVYIVISFMKKERKNKEIVKKRQLRRDTIRIASVYDEIMKAERDGGSVDIEAAFITAGDAHPVSGPPRYRAWKCLAYWIASKYAAYDYNWQISQEVNKFSAKWFGKETVAHSKIVALDEIINRSTKYLLDEHKDLYVNKPVEQFDELFDMVDMITDSIWKENY